MCIYCKPYANELGMTPSFAIPYKYLDGAAIQEFNVEKSLPKAIPRHNIISGKPNIPACIIASA